MNNKGLLIILSGPSGAGKDTILGRLFLKNDKIIKSISATTRKKRDKEIEGKDYHFISKDEFNDKILDGDMLEYACYCENYYGTSKSEVEKLRNDGYDVILKIEVEGAKQVMNKCGDALSIFIVPPSIKILKERLFNRGTESEKELELRLDRAREEINCAVNYDYIVVNDDQDKCAEDIYEIICAEKMRSYRIKNIINEVLKEC